MNIFILYRKTLFDLKVYFVSSVFKRKHFGGSLAWCPLSLMEKSVLAVDRPSFISSCGTVDLPPGEHTHQQQFLSFLSCLEFHSFFLVPGQRKLPLVKAGGLAQESPAGLLTSSAAEKSPGFHTPSCLDALGQPGGASGPSRCSPHPIS